MTLLRKLAVRISAFVVRHAPAGSREWAEGLAREIQFIESDSKALGWALGSLRVLFNGPRIVLKSLSEIPAAEKKFRSRLSWQYDLAVFASLSAALIQGGATAALWHRVSPLQRSGLIITTLALLLLTQLQLLRRRNGLAEKVPSDCDSQTCARFFKSELQREHDYRAHRWYLAEFPAFVFYLIGLSWIVCSRSSLGVFYNMEFVAYLMGAGLSADSQDEYPFGWWRVLDNPLAALLSAAFVMYSGFILFAVSAGRAPVHGFSTTVSAIFLGVIGSCTLLGNFIVVRRYRRRIEDLEAMLEEFESR
jgi:hypothetical protein